MRWRCLWWTYYVWVWAGPPFVFALRPLIDSMHWYHSRQVSKGISPAPRSDWTHRNYPSKPKPPPPLPRCFHLSTQMYSFPLVPTFKLRNSDFLLFFSVIEANEEQAGRSLFLPSLIFCRLYLVSWVGPDQCSSSSPSCSDHYFISTISRTDTCGESHIVNRLPLRRAERERELRLKQREE